MTILNYATALKQKQGKDLEKDQISMLTGIKGASTIRNALSKLKNELKWITVTKVSCFFVVKDPIYPIGPESVANLLSCNPFLRKIQFLLLKKE